MKENKSSEVESVLSPLQFPSEGGPCLLVSTLEE